MHSDDTDLRSTDSHRRLGATVIGNSTRFEVWAPEARSVDVVVDDGAFPLSRFEHAHDPGVATWIGDVEGVGHGDRYRLSVDGGDSLPDPASRWQPDGVNGPSAVVDPAQFTWTDDSWTGVALSDAVIYELHIGTFTPEGTFDAAIGQLTRLADLGITVVEVMPVNAFPGERNWGYDGVFPFATQASYGGPEGFARFVDAAHAAGLAVILDVVDNHLGPEGNVLGSFGPYFTDAYGTPWGPAVNVADRGSDGVRRYFRENAVSWLTDFHLDGFRFDAVHAIVDPTARTMMEEIITDIRSAAGTAGRTALITLESAANDPRQVRSPSDHGWGADAMWNDDVHHALRVALTGERHEYYSGYSGVAALATALEHRFVYHGQHSPVMGRRHGVTAGDVDHRRFIAFSTNHDHVGNTPRGERIFHGAPIKDPRRRLAAAFVLLSPFTPLLFMGDEYGETAPFPYFVDHASPELIEAVRKGRAAEFSGADWSGAVADPADPQTFASAVLDPSLSEASGHAELLAMHAELLRLRREHRALADPVAVRTVDQDGDLLTLSSTVGHTTATVMFNFSDHPVTPDLDSGRLVFTSASASWGGPGQVADRTVPAHTAVMFNR